MTSLSYTDEAIQASPLIDTAQWQALQEELGTELLQDCAKELLAEVCQQWVDSGQETLGLPLDVFCSMAHKSAGAAGTMAFARLRHVFLALEHGRAQAQTATHLTALVGVFQDTQLAVAKLCIG